MLDFLIAFIIISLEWNVTPLIRRSSNFYFFAAHYCLDLLPCFQARGTRDCNKGSKSFSREIFRFGEFFTLKPCLSPFSVMLWIRSNYLFRSEARYSTAILCQALKWIWLVQLKTFSFLESFPMHKSFCGILEQKINQVQGYLIR